MILSVVSTHLVARVPDASSINVSPDSTGLPGGQVAQQILNGLAWFGLIASAIAVVVGAATWGMAGRAGNYGAVGYGKSAVMGGALGALVVGAAAGIVNFFYGAGLVVH